MAPVPEMVRIPLSSRVQVICVLRTSRSGASEAALSGTSDSGSVIGGAVSSGAVGRDSAAGASASSKAAVSWDGVGSVGTLVSSAAGRMMDSGGRVSGCVWAKVPTGTMLTSIQAVSKPLMIR